ncbi:hypothetical protein Ancab_011240 [Ancistrocladus abbreviatus]
MGTNGMEKTQNKRGDLKEKPKVTDTQSGMKMETIGRATSKLDCLVNYTNAPPIMAVDEGETRGLTGTSTCRSINAPYDDNDVSRDERERAKASRRNLNMVLGQSYVGLEKEAQGRPIHKNDNCTQQPSSSIGLSEPLLMSNQ